MLARLTSLHLFVVLMGIAALAMMGPALFAILARDDHFTARIFLYGAILTGMLAFVIGLATQNIPVANPKRSQLVTLFASFAVLPAIFALPFMVAAEETSFINAWFEMVSSFTTTGATLYGGIGDLNASLHLWRALVGWLGGLFIWVAAFAILAPMNIGGFEVRALGRSGEASRRHTRTARAEDPADRILRFTRQLFPIYFGLTALLFLGLLLAGEFPLVAIVHAMSTLATSGITPVAGLSNSASGLWGEVLIFVFLIFSFSRLTYSKGTFDGDTPTFWRDPELRMAAGLIGFVTLALFMRHFLAAIDEDRGDGISEALHALWGTVFTVTSFLSTTGFESLDWELARFWSRLETPGLVLVGLALIGGGVATTAGGVKLLRVYALARHGERELDRLVYPNSIGGGGSDARRIRRQGAYISWIFFMLFALSIAAVMLLLSLTGVSFEDCMVLAVSAISTTGPLAQVAAEQPISYAQINDAAKVILALTMVLGRLETLALIALLNPEFWRN